MRGGGGDTSSNPVMAMVANGDSDNYGGDNVIELVRLVVVKQTVSILVPGRRESCGNGSCRKWLGPVR